VSARCVMVHLPWKHVERLAILSVEIFFVSQLARCDPLRVQRVSLPAHATSKKYT